MTDELKRYEAAAGIAFIGDDRDEVIRQLQAERDALIADNARLRERGPIDWREGPPPDELKDGRPVLLDVAGRVVLGRCYRQNHTRADTSNWWNFESHGCDESRVTSHCPVTS